MANVSSFSGAMPVIPGGTVELGYSVNTATYSITNTSLPATSVTPHIGPVTFVSDGSPVLVEWFASEVKPPTVAGGYVSISLYVDGAERCRYWGVISNGTVNAIPTATHLSRRLSDLSAGSHTVDVRVSTTSTTGSPAVTANTDATTSGDAPAFLRVSKIVNQNDGLKPFWTPPVVTQLPSQATVGDQVIYAADATNGVYWHLQYDGLGTYPWKFIGGSDLFLSSGGSGNTSVTANTWATPTSASTLTLPLAGDYDITAQVGHYYGSSGTLSLWYGYQVGSTAAAEADAANLNSTAASSGASVFKTNRKTGISASTVLTPKIKSSSTITMYIEHARLSARPIRVAA